MINFSKFGIKLDGEFIESQVPDIGLGFSIDYIRPDLLSISSQKTYEGETALLIALELLKSIDGALARIGVHERDLTLSFYYESQCAFGFNCDELKQLYLYVNSLAIDCYEV